METNLDSGSDVFSQVGSQLMGGLQDTRKELKAGREKISGQLEKLDKSGEQYQTQLNSARTSYQKTIDDLASEKAPEAHIRSPMEAFGGAATWMGILGGLLTKRPLVTGLKAATAAMTAYRQNDMDTFKSEYETWKLHTEHALKMAQLQNDQMNAIINDRKASVDEILGRANAYAHLNHDTIAAQMLETNGLNGLINLVTDRQQYVTSAQEHKVKMEEMGDKLQGWKDVEKSEEYYKASPQQRGMMRAAYWDPSVAAAEARTRSLATLGQQQSMAIEELVSGGMSREDAIRRVKGGGASAALDQDTLDQMADQYLAGDKTVIQGLGYGNTGAENRAKLRETIARKAKDKGMSGADIATSMAEFQGLASGERALGTRTAQVGMAVNEAKQLAPLVLQTSNKVDRTKYPDVNAILLAGEQRTGNPDVVRFGIAVNSMINVYARAISPTGVPTISDKDHARELLSTSWSNGQISAGMDQLMLEMQAALGAPASVRKEFREYGLGMGNDKKETAPQKSESPRTREVPSGATGDQDGTVYEDAQGNRWRKNGSTLDLVQ